MPRQKTLSCADCGTPMWKGRGSLPQGEARCHPCRSKRPASVLPAFRKGRWRIRSRGFCARCAVWFESTTQNARFCSLACANADRGRIDATLRQQIRNRRKRVRRLLTYVGERDRWRCGICGGAVVRGPFSVSDPLCAVVDHVVPVAEGGSDDPANLRLSHMICNARRGTRGGCEQLALVG